MFVQFQFGVGTGTAQKWMSLEKMFVGARSTAKGVDWKCGSLKFDEGEADEYKAPSIGRSGAFVKPAEMGRL